MANEDQSGLYKLLGELSADMKHVLRSLDASRNETDKLREEVHAENEDLKTRLVKVEKFNTRVIGAASVALPIVYAIISWVVPTLMNTL